MPAICTSQARPDGVNTICSHTYKRENTPCSESATHGRFCLLHAHLEAPDEDLGTCIHQFESGPRKGFYCTALAEGGLCVMHATVTQPKGPHCSHQWTRGSKTGGFCMDDLYQKGMCYNHYVAVTGLEQPESTTCSYSFSQGVRAGLYCPRTAGENGRCSVHTNSTIRTKKTKAAKPKPKAVKTSAPPCEYVYENGKSCTTPALRHTTMCTMHERARIAERRSEPFVDGLASVPKPARKPAGKPEAHRKYPPHDPPMRCKGRAVAVRRLCQSRASVNGFCRHHQDYEDTKYDATSKWCRATIVKYRACKKSAVLNQHCLSHQE